MVSASAGPAPRRSGVSHTRSVRWVPMSPGLTCWPIYDTGSQRSIAQAGTRALRGREPGGVNPGVRQQLHEVT